MSEINIQAGLAEAVRLVMETDPEDDSWLAECIDSCPCGDTGDYSYCWNEKKLEEKFGLKGLISESPKNRIEDFIEGMYWEQILEKDSLDTFARLVKGLMAEVDLGDVSRSKHSNYELLRGWVAKYAKAN